MKRALLFLWLCALCVAVQAQTDKGVSSTGQLGTSGDTRSFVDERGHKVNHPRLMRKGKIIEICEPIACPGVATVTDYEGHVYNTVQIGEQCWMRENLYTTRYPNGSTIATSNLQVPNHNDALIPTFGYLYQWSAVMNGATSSEANPSGVQGICPNGWHVPSRAELSQLVNYVYARTSCYPCLNKALVSEEDWTSSPSTSTACNATVNPESNNRTGFSLKPAGHTYGSYNENFGIQAFLYSCTQSRIESGQPYVYDLTVSYNYSNESLMHEVHSSQYLSVRCILD